MKKLGVLLYSMSLLGLSFYGLSTHSYYVRILLNLSAPYILVRCALVVVLAAYAFVPGLRLYATRDLLGISGVVLLLLGLLSVGSPTLLGHTHSYMLIGDTLAFIEAGILAAILSIELPARKSRFIANGILHVELLLATRPRKLVLSPPQPVEMLRDRAIVFPLQPDNEPFSYKRILLGHLGS